MPSDCGNPGVLEGLMDPPKVGFSSNPRTTSREWRCGDGRSLIRRDGRA
jgi:hypothetical protein